MGDAGGTALTRTGMIMGTPSYMAPEQARGDKVDHRADIYAVGGILYRALTGKKPFDSDDPSATLTQVLTEDPERPRSIDPTIPQALELVIQRAMEKKPEDRYQSMAELEADLLPFDPDPTTVISESSGDPTLISPAGAAMEKVEGGAQTVLVCKRHAPRRFADQSVPSNARCPAVSADDRGAYDRCLPLGAGGARRCAERNRAHGARLDAAT